MPSFFRIMVIVGLATLGPMLVVLCRQSPPPSTMTTPSTDSLPVSIKLFGRSALSHGDPIPVPSVPIRLAGDHGDFEPGQTVSFRKDEGSGPTEVVIAKRDVRRLPDGRRQDLYEVRFADGTTAWVPRQALLESNAGNERSAKER